MGICYPNILGNWYAQKISVTAKIPTNLRYLLPKLLGYGNWYTTKLNVTTGNKRFIINITQIFCEKTNSFENLQVDSLHWQILLKINPVLKTIVHVFNKNILALLCSLTIIWKASIIMSIMPSRKIQKNCIHGMTVHTVVHFATPKLNLAWRHRWVYIVQQSWRL